MAGDSVVGEEESRSAAASPGLQRSGDGCGGEEPVQSWLQSDGGGDSKALSTDTAASGGRPSSSPFVAASFSLEGV